MRGLFIFAVMFLLATTVYGDDSSSLNGLNGSGLNGEIDSQITSLYAPSGACEIKHDHWTWTRADIAVTAAVFFGIHDVLDISVSPEIVFIWVKKGHEPD